MIPAWINKDGTVMLSTKERENVLRVLKLAEEATKLISCNEIYSAECVPCNLLQAIRMVQDDKFS